MTSSLACATATALTPGFQPYLTVAGKMPGSPGGSLSDSTGRLGLHVLSLTLHHQGHPPRGPSSLDSREAVPSQPPEGRPLCPRFGWPPTAMTVLTVLPLIAHQPVGLPAAADGPGVGGNSRV